jgi:uncharacterized protein (DUF1697 family)
MPKYAAFLRGINIGGRRVKNDALARCFESMGFEDVAVHIASGNVIFSDSRRSADKLTKLVEEGLERSLGFDVTTFLRTAAEMRALATFQPFPPELVAASDGKLQVALLLEKPPKDVQAQVLALETDLDRLTFGDRELYWLPSGRMSDSALNMRSIDKLLAPMTMRTKNTIDQIARKYFDA